MDGGLLLYVCEEEARLWAGRDCAGLCFVAPTRLIVDRAA